jgi:hypothetical protein
LFTQVSIDCFAGRSLNAKRALYHASFAISKRSVFRRSRSPSCCVKLQRRIGGFREGRRLVMWMLGLWWRFSRELVGADLCVRPRLRVAMG